MIKMERRYREGEEEEEEVWKKKLYETGTTQQSNMKDEESSTIGYKVRYDNLLDLSHKGNAHHKHCAPVWY